MSKQGYTPNFKWSVADLDRIFADAHRGLAAVEICAKLEGTILASPPQEIIKLCDEAGIAIRRGQASSVSPEVVKRHVAIATALRAGRKPKQVAYDLNASLPLVYLVASEFGISQRGSA